MLEDRGEELLAETRAVRMVRGFALTAAADPVRHLFENHCVADQQLNHVGLGGGHAHGYAYEIALALKRRPASLPRDLIATRPGLADCTVAREGDVLAVLVAAAYELGHVLVDVLRDQRCERKRAVVDRRPVLDLEDGVRRRRQRADDARVARAERSALDELDVPPAPPALAFTAGEVAVRASPTPTLAAVGEGADAWRLRPVGAPRDGDLRLGDQLHRSGAVG